MSHCWSGCSVTFVCCFARPLWNKILHGSTDILIPRSREFQWMKTLKGARSRNFRQFQHWSSGHRINWNNEIMAQNYKRTQTKHRKAKKGQEWIKLGRIEMDCIWVNLKNIGPPSFKFISGYIKMSFKQLENHSQLLCGRDFKMKDSCSANLMFRAHN